MARTLDEQEAILTAWTTESNRWHLRASDDRVRHLESVCQRSPQSTESREIVQTIARVRDALAKGDAARAAGFAVVVGVLAAEAGPDFKLGLKRRAAARHAGRRRGVEVSAKAQARAQLITKLTKQYRNSDQDESLIAFLATRLNVNRRTVQRYLKSK